MGFLFRSSTMDWWLYSPSDARFRASGTCEGGLSAANEAMTAWIRARAAELGADPPSDIEINAVKQ